MNAVGTFQLRTLDKMNVTLSTHALFTLMKQKLGPWIP